MEEVDKAVKDTLVRAMKIAKEAWEEAEMPSLYNQNRNVALAVLVNHIYDQIVGQE